MCNCVDGFLEFIGLIYFPLWSLKSTFEILIVGEYFLFSLVSLNFGIILLWIEIVRWKLDFFIIKIV